MTKVLVFESDHGFAMELRSQLSELGCTVQVFSDGHRGMMAAASATPPPQLLIVAVELQRVNGFSICNKMKKHPQLNRVPLMLLSSHSSPETFAQHQQLPTRANAYIHKPVTFAQLLPQIEALVQLPRHSRDLSAIEEIEEIEAVEVLAAHDDSDGDAPTRTAGREMTAQVRGLDAADPALRSTQPQEEAIITRSVRRPSAFSGYASAAQREREAKQAQQDGFLQYRLTDEDDDEYDDEDEQTIVASRAMLEVAQAHANAIQPSSAPPRSSEPPRTAAEAYAAADDVRATLAIPPLAATGQSWPVHPIAAPAASYAVELTELRQALARATQRAEGAERELVQLRPTAAEAEPLRVHVEALQQRLTTSSNNVANYQQQANELRVALEARDQDLLQLRETLGERASEVLELRETALQADKDAVALYDQISALEREQANLEEQLQTHQADRDMASKRADDFKQGARKIAEQLNQRTRELRDVRTAHEETLSQQQTTHNDALRKLEAQLRQNFADIEKKHQQKLVDIEALHADELQKSLQSSSSAQSDAFTQQQRAWDEARSALDNEIATLKDTLEDATERQTMRNEEHEALLKQLSATHETRIAHLVDEHETQVEQADTALTDQKEQLLQEQQQALASSESAHAVAVQKLQEEVDTLQKSLDEERSSSDERLADASEVAQQTAARIETLETSLQDAKQRTSTTRARWMADRDALERAKATLSSVVDQLTTAPPPPVEDE